MSEPRRVLVTGATGFVGRRLMDALRGQPSWALTAAVRNQSELPASVHQVRVGDLSPRTDWRVALSGVDSVVHLAARVHILNDRSTDPLGGYRQANVEGTLALAKQAASAGCRRFVFISSIKVNGEATSAGKPFTENDGSLPTDPYGISKAEAEKGLAALAASSAMEVVIIRPPLVYGPGVKANFRSMIRAIARGVPLPLGAVTANRRSFVAIDNLVDLVVTCLDHPAAANEIFLVGDGEDLSTADLVRRIAAALAVPARLLYVPVTLLTAAGELLGKRSVVQRLVGNLQVDTSKAMRVLGWTPPIGVDEGLRRATRPGLGYVAGR